MIGTSDLNGGQLGVFMLQVEEGNVAILLVT